MPHCAWRKHPNSQQKDTKKLDVIFSTLLWTYLSSSSVMVPLGSASTLLPQNLSLG